MIPLCRLWVLVVPWLLWGAGWEVASRAGAAPAVPDRPNIFLIVSDDQHWGDFAFMGPLYAHLSRDPYPSAIMKRDAWPVWSWVERMIVPISGTGQYGEVSSELFGDDTIPQTLKDLLAYMGREFADEVAAHVGFIDGYLADNPDVQDGDVINGKATRRSLGKFTWNWHGHDITTHAIPYRVLHLQRIQAQFELLDDATQAATRALLTEAGLEVLIDLKPRRRVERFDNREVWGTEQEAVLPTAS